MVDETFFPIHINEYSFDMICTERHFFVTLFDPHLLGTVSNPPSLTISLPTFPSRYQQSIMVKKKGKSKRMTFKQKYKIERHVKEHKRKNKKETKRRAKLGLPPIGIGQRKNDTSIPNAWPFKEQLLEELATAKRNKEDEEIKKKEEAVLRRKQGGLIGKDVTDLVKQATAAQQSFSIADATKAASAPKERALGQQSRRAFIRDLKEVVEQADVVLEVLDARDPLGSRAEAVEELILRKPNKKLVLVLNKVDLVPKEVVSEWLAYLRRFHPTVAFKCATQEQKSQLSQHAGDASKASANVLSRSGSVGAEALMQLLKNYCRSLDIKTSISVGIVGYPNVGKSSVINSLKRTKAAGVSSTPGFTKCMQEVQLDKNIKLLDSPGIVFDDADVEGVLLRNCVNVDSLSDPPTAVAALLKRCDSQDLMMIYALPRFDPADVQGFLALLARKMGKLLKGGVPDRNSAARVLLRDWNTGKVPFYTKPPSLPSSSVEEEAQLVGTLGAAFNTSTVIEEGDAKLMAFLEEGGKEGGNFVAFESGGVAGGGMMEDIEEEDIEEEEMMDMDDEENGEEEEEVDGEVEVSEAPVSRSTRGGARKQHAAQALSQQRGTNSKVAATMTATVKGKVAAASVPKEKGPKKRGKAVASSSAISAVSMMMTLDNVDEDGLNPQVNQAAKKKWAAEKKKARKITRRTGGSGATAMDEAYDFATDFS